MIKRSYIPDADAIAIATAFNAALKGHGRQLAEMVKGFSHDDLALAFRYVARADQFALVGLCAALSFAAGRKEERARAAEYRRCLRKARRAER